MTLEPTPGDVTALYRGEHRRPLRHVGVGLAGRSDEPDVHVAAAERPATGSDDVRHAENVAERRPHGDVGTTNR